MLKPQAGFNSRIAQIAASGVRGQRLKQQADDAADTPDDSARRHKATASEILATGQKRRGEILEAKPTGLAAKIIEAGQRRRGDT